MTLINRRRFVQTSVAASAAALSLPSFSTTANASSANDEINLGFISCGGRASELMGFFQKIDGVNIGGLCDPDESRLGAARSRFPKAKAWQDLRNLIEDKTIDAVVVATCNHWHCLAAIWAMESGKDVYVEKPLSHSQWEGEQTVAAARKYDRVCQVGTQQRSDPMQSEIKEFLHQEKALGEIVSARVNRYGVRRPIGKRTEPLQIDSNLNYDLWLGPAQEKLIYRDNLHYDWHWDWNTGSGEMGNWGVHVLDDLRNNVFQDAVALPKRIFGGGGRIAYNDAGETPNVHFVYFDTGSIPVVIGLSNLTAGKGQKEAAPHPGPGSGYIAYCEGGRFEGQRGSAKAFDKDGKVIKQFRGGGGNDLHQKNFIDAVRARDNSQLNSEVQIGHDSTGWCNLANIAFRAGTPFTHQAAQAIDDSSGIWESLIDEMQQHIADQGVKMESDEIHLSPILNIENERFVGEHAQSANQFIKREYRDKYVIPEIG